MNPQARLPDLRVPPRRGGSRPAPSPLYARHRVCLVGHHRASSPRLHPARADLRGGSPPPPPRDARPGPLRPLRHLHPRRQQARPGRGRRRRARVQARRGDCGRRLRHRCARLPFPLFLLPFARVRSERLSIALRPAAAAGEGDASRACGAAPALRRGPVHGVLHQRDDGQPQGRGPLPRGAPSSCSRPAETLPARRPSPRAPPVNGASPCLPTVPFQVVCAHARGTMAEMRLGCSDVWLHVAPMCNTTEWRPPHLYTACTLKSR